MNTSDQNPRVPLWIFFATDLALLLTAWFIAARSAQPLSTTAMLAIVACVITGAAVALIPLVQQFERQKNEILDERQRALEALAQTIGASAEQISIATGGLHEIAELAQKNLRHAEQLPHRLQDKISEFQSQLANLNDAEKEELEKELAALRSTETERLESVSDKLARATAELAKIEAATQQHLVAANEALQQLARGTADAIGNAQAAAEKALSHAQIEAARQIGERIGGGIRSVESAKSAALAELDAKVSAAGALLPPPMNPNVSAKTTAATTAHEEKPRGLEPLGGEPAPTSPPPTVETAPPASATNGRAPAAAASSPRAGPKLIPPAEPGAPDGGGIAHPPRKRSAKFAATEPDTPPGLGLNEDTASSGVVERVLSSDGATRLLVTAYVGIGNRLFIRGEGPGLSWERGVPLQFVSIGKWRWETNDAIAPVRFKLLKNDEHECATLGIQKLDPAHQQEVMAAF